MTPEVNRYLHLNEGKKMRFLLSLFLLIFSLSGLAQSRDSNKDSSIEGLIRDVFSDERQLKILEDERLWYVGMGSFWDGLNAAMLDTEPKKTSANPNIRPKQKPYLGPESREALKKAWGLETEASLRLAWRRVNRSVNFINQEKIIQNIRERKQMPTEAFSWRHYPNPEALTRLSKKFEAVFRGEEQMLFEINPWAQWIGDLILLKELEGKITRPIVQELNWALIKSEGIEFLGRIEVQSAIGISPSRLEEFGKPRTRNIDDQIARMREEITEWEDLVKAGLIETTNRNLQSAKKKLASILEIRKPKAKEVYFEVLTSLHPPQKKNFAELVGEDAAREAIKIETWTPPSKTKKKAPNSN
jgi:hypothetical protein